MCAAHLVRLRAGWAVRGKPPGSYDEYRVTGCGGPDFSAGDYAHILRHFALGTPSPGRSGPAALPWVTISEVRGGDDGTRIGVALEDWTGEADGAGRPIAETRYLCVPYEALRAVPVSYTGLYEALAGLTPPFPADGVELGVAALDPAVPAQALQRFGVQRVAAAASLRSARPDAFAAVQGIGLAGQMHGAVLLDAAGEVLRPAILWNDTRSGAECEELMRRLPGLPQVAGNLAMPGFTAPKLLWVERHEPGVHARVAHVLLPKDWLRWRLTGAMASDMSDAAGTLWLDVGARAWSDALLEAGGMRRAQMPALV